MSTITSYLFLVLAVALGTASNSFAKSAEGFTLWIPSIITAITIVLCMYSLSQVMKVIPVGVTYASFAGLTINPTSPKLNTPKNIAARVIVNTNLSCLSILCSSLIFLSILQLLLK